MRLRRVIVGILFITILFAQAGYLTDKDFIFKDTKRSPESDFFSETQSPHKVLKTYDENWRLIENIEQYWSNNEWVNYWIHTYTYNNNNNQIESLKQNWDNNEWVNTLLKSYAHDNNNNQIELFAEYWSNNEWVNSSIYTYIYDNNNNQIENLMQYWGYNEWVNYWRYTYTYDDDNNQIELLIQNWDDNDWRIRLKYTYTYDDNNNQIELLKQNWVDNDWLNAQLETYTYDNNNNQIESINQYWSNSDWDNYYKYTYTYEEILDIDISDITSIPNHYNLSHPYPNPFNPLTTIQYELPQRSNVNVTIYDLLGKEVTRLVSETQDAGFKSVTWNATNDQGKPVSAGVYLYQIQAGNFVQTKKMVLLK